MLVYRIERIQKRERKGLGSLVYRPLAVAEGVTSEPGVRSQIVGNVDRVSRDQEDRNEFKSMFVT